MKYVQHKGFFNFFIPINFILDSSVFYCAVPVNSSPDIIMHREDNYKFHTEECCLCRVVY